VTGFSSATVAALTFDFTAFPSDTDPNVRCTGKGIVPEPSTARLKAFGEALRSLYGTDEPSEDAVVQSLEERIKEREDAIYKAYADLCAGKPSEEELRQLPPRIFGQFCAWLQGSFVPKA
jgi:hypothetical protein